MPYRNENSRGQTYYLHGKEVTLQSGRRQQIFCFAREPKAGEALPARPWTPSLPAGRSSRTRARVALPQGHRQRPSHGPASAALHPQGDRHRSADGYEAVASAQPPAHRPRHVRLSGSPVGVLRGGPATGCPQPAPRGRGWT
jgi:hypothetical protein